MIYYDETGNIIESPDLENGYVTEVKVKIGEHTELMAGTEGMGKDGLGLFRTVEDFELRSIYHQNPPEEEDEPAARLSIEERVAALEDTIDTLVLGSLEE